MKNNLITLLLLITSTLTAQTNVRAWYAQGQVWVVWQIEQPIPETVGIYKKATPFSNTSEASLIGRPFDFEYLPGTFFQQTGDPSFSYQIPKPDGSIYQLAPGEGLFVETVLNTGSAFYAVVTWGETAVTAGQNLTQTAVNFNYNPVTQPVNCHLQRTETLPTGHKTFWFSMWALGRQNENAGRPDFPVLANAAKNGMPSMFIISQALTLDTTNGQKIPMTHLFHGGAGVASQMMANRFKQFNFEPKKGISVAHNDDFPVNTTTETGDQIFTSGRSLWFGWTKRHDPFDYTFAAQPGDTVINYTQRRILWINDWLIKHFPIDPERVAVMGYSMGSGAATVLAKSFPDRFSTACMFNAGFRGADDATSVRIVGSMSNNLPTSLRGRNNEVIGIEEAFSLNVPCSDQRDFPILRVWVGKNDDNGRMHWGPEVAAQFRLADSLGSGAQLQWDERGHTYPSLNFHWIQGESASEQTILDNVSFQELFRSNQSYPAFFNHRQEPLNNEPGSGQLGINNGDGDNWGSWGGYHRWDIGTVSETPSEWSVSAWLASNASFPNDNCPADSLTSDLAIRKPQQFVVPAGTSFYWYVTDLNNGNIIQTGAGIAKDDGLVVLEDLVLYPEDIRKVRITVLGYTRTAEPEVFSKARIYPNPAAEFAALVFETERSGSIECRITGPYGVFKTQKLEAVAGENQIHLDLKNVPNGAYFVSIVSEKSLKTLRLVVAKP